MKIDELNYPALLFREGYIYIAPDAADLCTHAGKAFEETLKQQWKLVDFDWLFAHDNQLGETWHDPKGGRAS